MVVWAFNKAFKILAALGESGRKQLTEKIQLTADELDRWRDISKKIHISISDNGTLEQYEGYFDLQELDWDGYKQKYGNIGRMDRILKAEGKSPDDYKVSKQADALMTFYNLDPSEVRSILNAAGYATKDNLLRLNFDYYMQRTSHGSTLSKLVHSYLAILIKEKALSFRLYLEALASDFADIQGGTTKEGIHVGVMTGTALLALKAYAGLDVSGELVSIDPRLPEAWREATFNIRFRAVKYNFIVTPEKVKVRIDSTLEGPIDVLVRDRHVAVDSKDWVVSKLN
jgi:trehalose/maltose hydrolase-like predicted phosphorylase